MSPYTSLLVLALAASIVTPVLSAEAAQPLGKNEERAWSQLTLGQKKAVKMALGLLGVVVAAGAGGTAIYEGIKTHNKAQNVTGREERSFGRGMPVDISEDIQDRSFLDITRRTSSQLELLDRADLEEALRLFGRMLDELD